MAAKFVKNKFKSFTRWYEWYAIITWSKNSRFFVFNLIKSTTWNDYIVIKVILCMRFWVNVIWQPTILKKIHYEKKCAPKLFIVVVVVSSLRQSNKMKIFFSDLGIIEKYRRKKTHYTYTYCGENTFERFFCFSQMVKIHWNERTNEEKKMFCVHLLTQLVRLVVPIYSLFIYITIHLFRLFNSIYSCVCMRWRWINETWKSHFHEKKRWTEKYNKKKRINLP